MIAVIVLPDDNDPSGLSLMSTALRCHEMPVYPTSCIIKDLSYQHSPSLGITDCG